MGPQQPQEAQIHSARPRRRGVRVGLEPERPARRIRQQRPHDQNLGKIRLKMVHVESHPLYNLCILDLFFVELEAGPSEDFFVCFICVQFQINVKQFN